VLRFDAKQSSKRYRETLSTRALTPRNYSNNHEKEEVVEQVLVERLIQRIQVRKKRTHSKQRLTPM
jgi:hypothetical protein